MQLNEELKQLQEKIESSSSQILTLEEANASLKLEIQQTKEKSSQMQREANTKFEEQLLDLNQSKEKEFAFFQLEIKKLLEETEKVRELF